MPQHNNISECNNHTDYEHPYMCVECASSDLKIANTCRWLPDMGSLAQGQLSSETCGETYLLSVKIGTEFMHAEISVGLCTC